MRATQKLPKKRSSRERGSKRDTRFKKGNAIALKHGRYSRQAQLALLPGQEEIRAVLAARRARLLEDQGGTQDMGLVLEDSIDRYQRLWVLASTLEARLEQEGMLTGKGKTRAAVTLYLGIVDRLMKLAQQIGFDRKAKQLPTTLQDFLTQREQQNGAE